jgi:hypothetical protein
LKGGNSFAGSDEQIHSVEPFVQRNVRTLKNSPGPNSKIYSTGVAAIKAALARGDALGFGTTWAFNAIWPPATLKVKPRRLFIGKHFEQLEGANGNFVVHGIDLRI